MSLKWLLDVIRSIILNLLNIYSIHTGIVFPLLPFTLFTFLSHAHLLRCQDSNGIMNKRPCVNQGWKKKSKRYCNYLASEAPEQTLRPDTCAKLLRHVCACSEFQPLKDSCSGVHIPRGYRRVMRMSCCKQHVIPMQIGQTWLSWRGKSAKDFTYEGTDFHLARFKTGEWHLLGL